MKRKRKTFWANAESGRVVKVEGLSCAPSNPDYWWVSSLGMSMREGVHLFETERQAVEDALRVVERNIFQLRESEAKLRERLALLPLPCL